ncbi:hypothetical protein, partial [Pseudoalteromonas sp. SR44-8]|uniref:hypothetical protein n=1 Tax=Pseudoalteromonas sp. SR44-8 TaxID=2760933 RepID=UPI001C71C7C4
KRHESTSMCKHGFHFIHEMNYSSIAYFQGVMTGEGVKREIGTWSWHIKASDKAYLNLHRFHS